MAVEVQVDDPVGAGLAVQLERRTGGGTYRTGGESRRLGRGLLLLGGGDRLAVEELAVLVEPAGLVAGQDPLQLLLGEAVARSQFGESRLELSERGLTLDRLAEELV